MSKQRSLTLYEEIDREFSSFKAEWSQDGKTEITGAMVAEFFRSSEFNIDIIFSEIIDGDQGDALIRRLTKRLRRPGRSSFFSEKYFLTELMEEFDADDLQELLPGEVLDKLKPDVTDSIDDTIESLMDWDSEAVLLAIAKWEKYHKVSA